MRERYRPTDTGPLRHAASWLGFAASPTFALMAWTSASDMQAMMCSSGAGGLPLGDMGFMYLLMCFFHLSPWLRLASARAHPFTRPTTQAQGD